MAFFGCVWSIINFNIPLLSFLVKIGIVPKNSLEGGKHEKSPSKGNTDMEGRRKDMKDQRNKITRKEKRFKREKLDKEKTFKMLEKTVSL